MLTTRYLIIIVIALAFSMSMMLTGIRESFAAKNGSIDISLVNSSFIPLSNADANQIKASIEYTLEKKELQNQLINAVMEVYAPNGTLIRTTSTGSGFTLQIDGGEQVLRTTIYDESLQKVSIKVMFTDLSKKIPLSNQITDDLKLENVGKNFKQN